MTEKTAEAAEAYGDALSFDVDGEAVVEGALARLEREGVIERTGEKGKDTDAETEDE